MFWVWLILPLTGSAVYVCRLVLKMMSKMWKNVEKVGSAGSRFQTAPKNVEERFQQLDKFGTSIAPPCLFFVFSLLLYPSLSLWHFSFSASCLSIMFFSCWKSSHTTVTPNSGSKDALWCSPSATIWPLGGSHLSWGILTDHPNSSQSISQTW